METRLKARRLRFGVAAAIGIALAEFGASAQTAECPVCQTEKFVQGLPRTYEAVLVVNNASRQRQDAAGQALAKMLEEAGALPETARAWQDLARALDWTPDQAFDQLLGRKFTLIVRGLDGPGQPDWAVITDVAPEAEARLRERLKAAPRGNLAGLAVLAVEDGKYELMVGRGPGADPGLVAPGTDPTAAVLLGPGGDNPLFTELAPSLQSRSGLASPAAPWRAGQKDRDCDLVLMMRPKKTGDSTLTLTATLEREGWDAHLVCSSDLVWGSTAVRVPHAWSDGPIRILERDALLAVMGVVSGPTRPSVAFIPGIPNPAAWLGGAAEGRLGALAIHPAKGRAAAAETSRAANSASGVIIADRELPRIVGTRQTEPTALLGQWCITAGFEAPEGARAASEAQGLALRLLGAMETGEAPADSAIKQDPSGTEPGFQTLRVDDSLPIHESLIGRLTRLVGQEPIVSWGTRSRGPVVAAARRGYPAEVRNGWCVVSLSPSGEPMAEADANVLGAAGGTSRQRLSIGMVRPAALASVLGRDDATVPAWARRIGLLRWDAWERADGMIETTVSLKMAP